MKDQLISFETAKLAKEKGCNLSSFWWYDLGNNNELSVDPKNGYGHQQSKKGLMINTYEQSKLQKWLREKYNCFVEVSLHGEEEDKWNINPENLLFGVTVDYYGKDFEIPMTDEEDYSEYNFKSYEEALEKGLQEALKLIKKQSK